MGNWKAVKPKNGGAWQLFNLRSDGTETTDLAKAEPDRVRTMSARFEKWRKRVGAN
jgi:arylsulfatase